MSFYQGIVVKLTQDVDDVWEVLGSCYINTKNDNNMNIKFHHGTVIRVTFVPANLIHGFKSGDTVKVKRIFDFETGMEIWEAL
jgi:hypothetical protein